MVEFVYFFLRCGELLRIKAVNSYLMESGSDPEVYPVFYIGRKVFQICQFSYRKGYISQIFLFCDDKRKYIMYNSKLYIYIYLRSLKKLMYQKNFF